MNDLSDLPDDAPPRELRFLKWLVIILTSTMIVGLITIIGLLVTRMTTAPAPFALPEGLAMPDDVRAEAVTLSRDWVIVLSTDQDILFFDRQTGRLHQRMEMPIP